MNSHDPVAVATPVVLGPCTIYCGDALEVLKTIPDESVQCCVTSPPYWGLRDYGVTGQIGLENTPEAYVARMVEVFQEVSRVLREDGTCWVNLGDSYAATNKGDGGKSEKQTSNRGSFFDSRRQFSRLSDGLKPKDLCGIPWRVAFALQADGWWLRQDIIWHKPNPMPESVTDRCTKAHEYIFMLTKSARYYFDQEAIKEPAQTQPHNSGYVNGAEYAVGPMDRGGNSQREDPERVWAENGLRNKRSVWTVNTQPYAEAHFATFPPDLIKPCILAGTSAKGCCPKCGAPWERIVQDGEPLDEWKRSCGADSDGEYHGRNTKDYAQHKAQPASTVKERILQGMVEKKTVGWQPTCDCDGHLPHDKPELFQHYPTLPCTVLDPFGGSGTTGMVALELGRKAILIELNPEYVKLAKNRCDVTPGLPLA